MLTRTLALSAILICGSAATLQAQSPPKPDSTKPKPQSLPTITTTAPRDERVEFERAPNVGTITITGKELTQAPRFLGEADILRAIRMLPGVAARNDYSVGMNVRGGEADQNLILLDGYPIYNPFHLGGLFGAFVEPMVSKVDFYTGAFPASYGGRLSSVLDVHSAEEGRQGTHGSANLSLVATTLSLGSTTASGKTSWLVAGRRTYADKVIGLFTDEAPPYHFRDAQAHVTRQLSNDWKLSATWYDNLDNLVQGKHENDVFHISWANHLLGTSLSKTTADGRCPLTRFSRADSVAVRHDLSWSAFNMSMDLFSGALASSNTVNDLRYATRLTCYTDKHRRTTGLDLARQRFAFTANYPLFIYPSETLGADNSSVGVFYDELWRPNERWMVQAGGRVDAVREVDHPQIQPRLSVKYFITPDLAVTGAAGLYSQWAHSLSREDVPIRALDFWTGSVRGVPVSRSVHLIAGVERWLKNGRAIRVEAFLKSYPRLVEQNPLSDPDVPGDEFRTMRGTSYGADLMLRKFNDGGWTGWLAYSFAENWRIGADGVRFRPGQDRRHEVNLVMSRTGAKYTRALRFNLATGTPFSEMQNSYDSYTYHQELRRFDNEGGVPKFVAGVRNGARLPVSSRLDVSLTRNAHTSRGLSISPYLSIMNVYNAQNPFAYIDNYIDSPPQRFPLRQLPVFPTIGVSLAW